MCCQKQATLCEPQTGNSHWQPLITAKSGQIFLRPAKGTSLTQGIAPAEFQRLPANHVSVRALQEKGKRIFNRASLSFPTRLQEASVFTPEASINQVLSVDCLDYFKTCSRFWMCYLYFMFVFVDFQVRTLFVSGLPLDIKPRELYLLFRPFKVLFVYTARALGSENRCTPQRSMLLYLTHFSTWITNLATSLYSQCQKGMQQMFICLSNTE